MTYVATRTDAQRVAVHLLARARFAVEGRIGLMATPGGFGTPVLKNGVQLRVDGLSIIRDDRSGTDRCPLTSLRGCAVLAGVDLDAPFSVGHDTPPLGDDALDVNRADMARLADWFAFGWSVLEEVRTSDDGEPSEIQLWPEHFDAAFDTRTAAGRVNLGASPGDSYSDDPYLYVGPWGAERPGDPAFWNAPFGATLRTDSFADATAFFRRGLRSLRGVE